MHSFPESSLLRVASSTFEDLGFLLPERELTERQRAAPLDAAVRVDFAGAVHGRVEVRLFGGVLPVLAMNMLGEAEPPAEALQRDALGEVANVICGNVLPLLAGSREVFRLSAPVAAPPAASEGVPSCVTRVGLEGGRAEVLLFAEAPADAARVAP